MKDRCGVLRKLKDIINDPRLWLFAGAACFVVSFLMGYHQQQRVADQRIALYTAPAPTVTIQDFGAVRAKVETREVNVLAETDPGAPVAVQIEDDAGVLRTAVLYPLYPVSRAGRDALLRVEGAPLRPVPRPGRVRADRPDALGIVVQYAGSAEAGAKIAETQFGEGLGGGRFGRVVEIKGVALSPGNLEFIAKGAMAALGGALADDFIAIKPFEKSRMEAATPPPLSPYYSMLRAAAVVFGIVAIYLSVYPHLPAPRRRRKIGPVQDNASSAINRAFAPIATQDEIAMAEAEARARAYVSHPIVRILDGFYEEAKSLFRSRVKSRRSPRTD